MFKSFMIDQVFVLGTDCRILTENQELPGLEELFQVCSPYLN